MAKTYFDLYLNAKPNLTPNKVTLVLITCIRTAVKVPFNLISSLMSLETSQMSILFNFVANRVKICSFPNNLCNVKFKSYKL